ncbi:myb-related protein A [Ixodes scapularis]
MNTRHTHPHQEAQQHIDVGERRDLQPNEAQRSSEGPRPTPEFEQQLDVEEDERNQRFLEAPGPDLSGTARPVRTSDINVEELESATTQSPDGLSASNGSFGRLTVLELTDGTRVVPHVTPIKFTALCKKEMTGSGDNEDLGKESGIASVAETPVVSSTSQCSNGSRLETPLILRRGKRRRRHSSQSHDGGYSHSEADSTTYEEGTLHEPVEIVSLELLQYSTVGGRYFRRRKNGGARLSNALPSGTFSVPSAAFGHAHALEIGTPSLLIAVAPECVSASILL